MPRKFDQDAKDRVVRLVEDRIVAENMSMQAACQAVAPKLGVSWHTARQWTQQARRSGTIPEPVPEDLVAEVSKLRRENQELRDTNELLKAASAFSHRNSTRNVGNDPVHRRIPESFLSRVHLYDVEEQSRRWLHYLAWLSPIQGPWAKCSSPS